MDVASYQPRDLTALITEHNVKHVVVRMYLPGETPSPDHSRAQVTSALLNGCSVSPYMWAYRSFDPVASVRNALQVARSEGLDPAILWLDCETYLDVDHGPAVTWLLRAVRECGRRGVLAGLYSAVWWLQGYLQDWSDFTGLPLWLAQYDGNPTLDDVVLPAGWRPDMLWGKQYSADGIDLDVFRRAATE